MERVLTIEDFREWGRIGGNRRIANAKPGEIEKQAKKASRASVKARRLAKRQKSQAW